MIGHILRKDLKLLWPLVTAVAALQVITAVLLETAGPFRRWSSGGGSDYSWLSNGLLPFVCLVGLIALVLAAIHQDRFPGTTQDWLVRPIRRRTLVLAKLAFVGVAGLLPIFICDVVTGFVEHLPPGAVFEASAARCLLLLALFVLPAALVGVVTRSLADAIVFSVILLVIAGVEIIVAAQLKIDPPLPGTSYSWVIEAVLVCAIAVVVPLLVALQFEWRSTNRLRWIATAALAVSPLVLLLPWRPALVAQQLVGRGADAARLTLAHHPALPNRIRWAEDETRRAREPEAVARLTIPLAVALESRSDAWRIDHASFRIVTPTGQTIYKAEQNYVGRYDAPAMDGPDQEGSKVTAVLPVTVAENAISKRGIVEATLWVAVFDRSFQGTAASLDGHSLDASSRCHRFVVRNVAYTQCISPRPIAACTYMSLVSHPAVASPMRAAACGRFSYAPWPTSFWRDAFYTEEFADPSSRVWPDADDEEEPRQLSVANFVPRAHVVRVVATSLDGLIRDSGNDHVASRDGKGSAARFANPSALVSDRKGTIYLVDRADSVLRRIAPSGEVTTIAGVAGECGRADGHGTQARFCHPSGLTIDTTDNLYVVDSGNGLIRKVSPAGDVTTTATVVDPKTAGYPPKWLLRTSLAARAPDGSLYVVGLSRAPAMIVIRIAPDGTVSTIAGPDGR